FFQAEDGIRDFHVTGVQTCALPISRARSCSPSAGEGLWSSAPTAASRGHLSCLASASGGVGRNGVETSSRVALSMNPPQQSTARSEERRVGNKSRAVTRAGHDEKNL